MVEEVAEPTRSRALRCLELGRLTVRSQREGDVETITLTGELDLDHADAVEAELQRVEAGDALSIVLDLSRLTFMASCGVRLVLEAHERAAVDGGRLLLLRGPHAVHRVFEICGVDELLPFAS
jgi:anti-sigma B factor antagonist